MLDTRAAPGGEYKHPLARLELRVVLHYGDDSPIIEAHHHLVARPDGVLHDAGNPSFKRLEQYLAHALDDAVGRAVEPGLCAGQ